MHICVEHLYTGEFTKKGKEKEEMEICKKGTD